MQLSDIQQIFNRALAYSFHRTKLCIIFFTLVLCGLLVVFFRGLAIQTGEWVSLSMIFLPIFVTLGFLLSVGILLIRAYHDELKKDGAEFKKIFKSSWEVIIGASYFAVPMILGYLILWISLGIFLMLEQIPGLGHFFAVVLAFVPFLLNLSSIILCILSIAALFFITPLMALKGFSRILVSQYLTKRLQRDVFSNVLLFLIATMPFLFVVVFQIISLSVTESLYNIARTPVYETMQGFFIMIPFAALLSPTVIFFFNFAAESHVLLQKSHLRN